MINRPGHSLPSCVRQRTPISVHGNTAVWLQSNESLTAKMSEKCQEWRGYLIMTLWPQGGAPVKD